MLSEWVSEMRFRLRALFRRAAMERELDEELRHHIELETRKNVALGMAPDAAARRARLAFGGVERIKDDSRDARGISLVEGVAWDLRFAARGLRANPGFTAAVVLTLGLGLGANAAMFAVLDRLMFRPPAYLRDAERVHRVYLSSIVRGQERTDPFTEYKRYLDLARFGGSAFSGAAAFSQRTMAIGASDAAREMDVGTVSATYWSFFDARPALGRFFTAAEDSVPAGELVAVISHPFWQTHFGGRSDALGKPLQIGALTYTVIGVAPEGFAGVSAERPAAVWVPITAYAGRDAPPGLRTSYYLNYNWGWLQVLLRRKPGVTPEQATAALTAAYQRSWEVERALDPQSLATLQEARPHAIAAPVLVERGPRASPVGKVARWVSGVALVVLLIACANTANLLLGRALKRRRELALRIALGVSRGRLAAQLLTESLLLATLGGVAGLLVAQWAGALLAARFLPDSAPPNPIGDPRTLLFAALAVVAAGVLTGIVPALRAAGQGDLAGILKSSGRGTSMHRSRTRAGLVVLQGALSVVLLVGAGLFVRSLRNVNALRLGYDVDPVMLASVNLRGTKLPDAQRPLLAQRLREEAVSIPGVEQAAFGVSVPFWSTYGLAIYVPGIDSVRKLGRFTLQAATPEYFQVMGTRVLRGRGITAADRAGAPRVIVVSESMARTLWPGKEALGQCVRVRADTMPCNTVVGIAEDIKQNSLSDDPGLNYYLSLEQFGEMDDVSLFVRTRGPAAAQMETVRRHLQRLMPGSAYVTLVPMREIVGGNMRSWELGASMFLAFGALALVVAAIGLYGVIAYNVAQRTQELGVRMALGARVGSVLALVLGQGVRFAVAGVVVGGTIALVAGRWVAPLLFQVSPRDPAVFAAVVALVLLVATLASLIPAIRASRVDPVTALRHD